MRESRRTVSDSVRTCALAVVVSATIDEGFLPSLRRPCDDLGRVGVEVVRHVGEEISEESRFWKVTSTFLSAT